MVVSSLFLKKMVTQTLQSGQRSHHLLFNYERDNFAELAGMVISFGGGPIVRGAPPVKSRVELKGGIIGAGATPVTEVTISPAGTPSTI